MSEAFLSATGNSVLDSSSQVIINEGTINTTTSYGFEYTILPDTITSTTRIDLMAALANYQFFRFIVWNVGYTLTSSSGYVAIRPYGLGAVFYVSGGTIVTDPCDLINGGTVSLPANTNCCYILYNGMNANHWLQFNWRLYAWN